MYYSTVSVLEHGSECLPADISVLNVMRPIVIGSYRLRGHCQPATDVKPQVCIIIIQRCRAEFAKVSIFHLNYKVATSDERNAKTCGRNKNNRKVYWLPISLEYFLEGCSPPSHTPSEPILASPLGPPLRRFSS